MLYHVDPLVGPWLIRALRVTERTEITIGLPGCPRKVRKKFGIYWAWHNSPTYDITNPHILRSPLIPSTSIPGHPSGTPSWWFRSSREDAYFILYEIAPEGSTTAPSRVERPGPKPWKFRSLDTNKHMANKKSHGPGKNLGNSTIFFWKATGLLVFFRGKISWLEINSNGQRLFSRYMYHLPPIQPIHVYH